MSNFTELNNDPLVRVYKNVITPEECEHFINISKNKLQRALVSMRSGGLVSKGRTGSNAWIKHNHDTITQNVANRISKIVNMPLENAESFQIIYYGVTQEYRNHYDSWEHDGSEKTLRCMKYGGARLVTVLCYLNNVKKGGGTHMTKLDITIPAKKGNMLLFHNTISLDNHNRHILSEHAGMPIEEGEKYAFNLWFRESNRSVLYKKVNYKYYKEVTELTDKNELVSNTEAIVSARRVVSDVDTYCDNLLLPDKLQIGDYIPFIHIKGEHRNKEIYNYCNAKPFMFITTQYLNNEIINTSIIINLSKYFNIIVLFETGNIENPNYNILYTKDIQLAKLLNINLEPLFYITSPNRRILNIITTDDIVNLQTFKINDYMSKNIHIPYLLIENALDDVLLKKVIDFYYTKKNENKLTKHSHKTKDRLHVHPDAHLEKEIDHKLSRSVLPELKKVFYFDSDYRETYKICSYDAETSGRFHAHRDTPSPYQHRKYALSLLLNDDYDGGEFFLPEYGIKIKPKTNTAFIFPGINTHQVLPVTKGSRMTIISFFISGVGKSQYKMKASYYKDKKIIESDVYPL